jgi:hypothetical protein
VKRRSVDRLRCPRCLGEGVEAPFETDLARSDEGETSPGDVVEAFLVCRRCRAVRPVVQGIAVVPRDVDGHLAARGNVYRRAVVHEPRLARFLLSRVGSGADVVPFEEVVARYGDLALPPGPADPSDVALDAALREAEAEGPALEVGCGVGRATFRLAARCGDAVGVDRSDARVRRARHVQTAGEFLLPAEGAEVPLDLARLARADADFVVADPEALPFARGAFATVVLQAGDGIGAWADPSAVLREGERVLAPGGRLFVREVSGWTTARGRAGTAVA